MIKTLDVLLILSIQAFLVEVTYFTIMFLVGIEKLRKKTVDYILGTTLWLYIFE